MDSIAWLILLRYEQFKTICQHANLPIPQPEFYDLSLWLRRDLAPFGKALRSRYEISKQHPAARDASLEAFYNELISMPGATNLFPLDHKQAAFSALDLSLEEQSQFDILLDGLVVRDLHHQIPRFWLKHANSYKTYPSSDFIDWFYRMISADPAFLSDLASNLKFVKRDLSVLWDYLSQHKLYYLFTLGDHYWKIGQSSLTILSVRPHRKKFTHNGRSLEITNTHLIIDGRQVLPSDLFGYTLTCRLAELFDLFDKIFPQALQPAMAAPPAAPALQALQGQDQVSDQNPCSICLENKSNVTLLPCGHLCVCIGCHNNFIVEKPQCPTCRAAVIGSVKTFY